MSPQDIIRALRAKTVARGCTPGEAASAEAKADQLCEKHGLPKGWGKDAEPQARRPRRPDPGNPYEAYREHGFSGSGRAWTGPEFEEMMRNMTEELARQMREEARRKAEAWTKSGPSGRSPAFKSVKEAVLWCLRPGVRSKKTGKPPSNEEIASVVRRAMGTNTTAASVAWYRSKHKKGEI